MLDMAKQLPHACLLHVQLLHENSSSYCLLFLLCMLCLDGLKLQQSRSSGITPIDIKSKQVWGTRNEL
jgi:hypothetical protein